MPTDGYPMEDVIMKWKGDRPVQGVEKIELPQFTLRAHEANQAIESLSTGKLTGMITSMNEP